jgi:hypothetical protein
MISRCFFFLSIALLITGRAIAQTDSAAAKISTDSLIAWVANIDANPDPLHSDYTPAVMKLSRAGLAGIKAVLPLLSAKESDTRMHAERVVEMTLCLMNGWVPGHGFPAGCDGESTVRSVMLGNGSYAYDAPEATREASVALWKAWVEKQAH